jgi:Helix-turn-helix domain
LVPVAGRRFGETDVTGDYERFWSTAPEKVDHPYRVPIVEALLWIGEPLSAIELVDVLDGYLTMWDATYHLHALEGLDVVEPISPDASREPKRDDGFDVPYRLKVQEPDEDG